LTNCKLLTGVHPEARLVQENAYTAAIPNFNLNIRNILNHSKLLYEASKMNFSRPENLAFFMMGPRKFVEGMIF